MAVTTIDEYLAGVAEAKRAALERLRGQIQASAPDATEAISYGRPAFKLNGRWLVGFSATKTHCSFYVGAGPLKAHLEELAGHQLWKGTINFLPDRPLSPTLVSKLVRDARAARAVAGQ